MSKPNIIDLSTVVGSDTLFSFKGVCETLFKFDSTILKNGYRAQISQNIWQSTANNLVIPEGLICDIEHLDKGVKEYFQNKRSGFQLDAVKHNYVVTAIRVTGQQEDWFYQWELGDSNE